LAAKPEAVCYANRLNGERIVNRTERHAANSLSLRSRLRCFAKGAEQKRLVHRVTQRTPDEAGTLNVVLRHPTVGATSTVGLIREQRRE